MPEAVTWRCPVKKMFLNISQNAQENTCVLISFLINLCFPVSFAKFLLTLFNRTSPVRDVPTGGRGGEGGQGSRGGGGGWGHGYPAPPPPPPLQSLNCTRSTSFSFKDQGFWFLWLFRNYTDQKFHVL